MNNLKVDYYSDREIYFELYYPMFVVRCDIRAGVLMAD